MDQRARQCRREGARGTPTGPKAQVLWADRALGVAGGRFVAVKVNAEGLSALGFMADGERHIGWRAVSALANVAGASAWLKSVKRRRG